MDNTFRTVFDCININISLKIHSSQFLNSNSSKMRIR